MKTTHITPLLALLLAGATGLAQAQHTKLDAGLSDLVANLKSAGANVTGVNAAFRRGAVSAYVPPNQIEGLAATSGLRVMKLSLRPQRNAAAKSRRSRQADAETGQEPVADLGPGPGAAILASWDRRVQAVERV